MTLELLWERAGLPELELPHDLHERYDGGLGFDEPCVVANFVETLDGIVAIPELEQSNALVADQSDDDKFVMGLLRACTDAVLVGAGTTLASPKGTWRPERVYPGWYQGRAVHIHVKVHLGGTVVHTGQFFFNDALTDAVYRRSPYNTRGSRDTRNSSDSIYRNGGSRSMLKLKKNGSGYIAAITMGVHRG